MEFPHKVLDWRLSFLVAAIVVSASLGISEARGFNVLDIVDSQLSNKLTTTPVKPVPIHNTTPVKPVPIHNTTPVKPVPIHNTTPVKPVPIHNTTPVKPVPIHNTTPVKPVPIHNTTPVKPVPIKPTTPVKPVPIKPTTPVAPTFPPPKPHAPVNTYVVKNGDAPCIVMKSGITLTIYYPVKGPKSKLKKATVQVPATAKASGKCDKSPLSQQLDINFFDDWSLNITFSKPQKLASNAGPTPYRRAYDISTIALTVKVDDKHFPDSQVLPGSLYTVTKTSTSFPKKAGDSDYYRCNSRSTLTLSDKIDVQTDHLEFKAFNAEHTESFDGKGAVCEADESDGGGISAGGVVGIVIAILVVAALVALGVMMYRRRRNSTYESIQYCSLA